MKNEPRCGSPELPRCLLSQLSLAQGRTLRKECALCSKTERDLNKELQATGRLFGVDVDELPSSDRESMKSIEQNAMNALELLDDCDFQEDYNHHGASERKSSRFRRLRNLARGGLGQVSIAQDHEIPREVAIKELLPKFATSASIQSRFLREAQITGMLEHPGIVPIYSVGRHRDGRPYYAMRLIQGSSLRAAIKEYHRVGPSLHRSEQMRTLRKLLRRFICVCDAVAYAHSHKVIHCDIKPDNIMLGQYGETLLVDWGVATILEPEVDDVAPLPVLTPPEVDPAGTLAFMSPEQASGDKSLLCHRSDVFSLGATLHNVLTGHPPYDPQAPDLADRVREVEICFDFPKTVPPALQAICRRALSRDAEDRYASADELAQDIECWLAYEPVSSFKEPLDDWLIRVALRHQTPVLVGLLAIAILMIAILLVPLNPFR